MQQQRAATAMQLASESAWAAKVALGARAVRAARHQPSEREAMAELAALAVRSWVVETPLIRILKARAKTK